MYSSPSSISLDACPPPGRGDNPTDWGRTHGYRWAVCGPVDRQVRLVGLIRRPKAREHREAADAHGCQVAAQLKRRSFRLLPADARGEPATVTSRSAAIISTNHLRND